MLQLQKFFSEAGVQETEVTGAVSAPVKVLVIPSLMLSSSHCLLETLSHFGGSTTGAGVETAGVGLEVVEEEEEEEGVVSPHATTTERRPAEAKPMRALVWKVISLISEWFESEGEFHGLQGSIHVFFCFFVRNHPSEVLAAFAQSFVTQTNGFP